MLLLFLLGQAGPFLDKHCSGCHSAETRKGGLDLSRPLDAARWVRVHDRLAAGEMPPGKKPPKEDVQKALNEIGESLLATESKRRAKDGRAAVRP
ncbi:MAG: hypothetical protein K2W96_19740 [Gemmataceae bacterium]|nr:hypothetical protein [Gemmataceae bacterium]